MRIAYCYRPPFLYEEEVRKAAMSLPSKAVEWSDAMYKHPRIGLTGEEGNAMNRPV